MRRLIKKSEFHDYVAAPNYSVSTNNEYWPVFKNPTNKEIRELKTYYQFESSSFSVRGVVLKDRTIYAWPSEILHESMVSYIPEMYDVEKCVKLIFSDYSELQGYVNQLEQKGWFDSNIQLATASTERMLIKKAFDQKLYHGTSLANFKNIVQAGMLMPNETEGGGQGGRNDAVYEGYSFFATTVEKALFYADWTQPSDAFVVIEFILPEDSLLPDDDDCPDCENWKDSADRIEQVKVLGSVTTNYITGVKFYNINQEMVFQSTLSNWEKDFQDNSSNFNYENNEEMSTKVSIRKFYEEIRAAGGSMVEDKVKNFPAGKFLEIFPKYFPDSPLRAYGHIGHKDVNLSIYNDTFIGGIMVTVYGNDYVYINADFDSIVKQCERNPKLIDNLETVFEYLPIDFMGGYSIESIDVIRQSFSKSASNKTRLKKLS